MLITRTGFTIDTKNRLMLDAGAVYRDFVDFAALGTCLGATRDGAVWDPGLVLRSPQIDGLDGDYKGLIRLVGARPTLTVNLLEATVANLLLAMPGASSTPAAAYTRVDMDYLGLGDGVDATFDTHVDIVAGSYRVYVDPAPGVGVLQVEGGAYDYTINLATGVITFNAGHIPAVGDLVMASYTYDAGGATTKDIIRPGDIEDGDYVGNIALVANLSGHTNPIALGIDNALADVGFSLKTAGLNEAVSTVKFKAHFDPVDPTIVPAWIWVPRT